MSEGGIAAFVIAGGVLCVFLSVVVGKGYSGTRSRSSEERRRIAGRPVES